MRKKKKIRLVRPILGAAAILLLLGFGNITFGKYKSHEYSALLATASRSAVTTPGAAESTPFGLTGETDTRSRYVAKLRARVDFYEFVVHGGWVIVCLSLLCFLSGLVVWRSDDDPIEGAE